MADVNHNPRDEHAERGPDDVRAALRIRRPTSPLMAAHEALLGRACPHCQAQPTHHCTVPATGRPLPGGTVHPSRLQLPEATP